MKKIRILKFDRLKISYNKENQSKYINFMNIPLDRKLHHSSHAKQRKSWIFMKILC